MQLAKVYLLINAGLYIAFVAWCSFKWQETSHASGYLTLSNAGRSEYLVIYGGLQLGMAAFFAYTALHPQYHQIALIFSLFIYAAIVIYRLFTIWTFWPVGNVTVTLAVLETLLLLGAIIVLMKTANS